MPPLRCSWPRSPTLQTHNVGDLVNVAWFKLAHPVRPHAILSSRQRPCDPVVRPALTTMCVLARATKSATRSAATASGLASVAASLTRPLTFIGNAQLHVPNLQATFYARLQVQAVQHAPTITYASAHATESATQSAAIAIGPVSAVVYLILRRRHTGSLVAVIERARQSVHAKQQCREPERRIRLFLMEGQSSPPGYGCRSPKECVLLPNELYRTTNRKCTEGLAIRRNAI